MAQMQEQDAPVEAGEVQAEVTVVDDSPGKEKQPLPEGEFVPLDPPGTWFSCRTFLRFSGPGWLMSLAFLDPGNLESDLQNGAYTGYSMVWVLASCTLAGLITQILAARMGAVTGRSLAQICRAEYPRPVAYTLWMTTELAIIGADIQEVVGTAIAFQELLGLPLWAGSIITGFDTFTFLAVQRCGSRLLEGLIVVLVLLLTVCFLTNWAMAPPPAADVFGGFVPRAPSYAVLQMVGTVGCVIMPHNVFLHSGLVARRPLDRGRPIAVQQANKYNAADAMVALAVSFIVNLSLITAFSRSFFAPVCAEADGGPFACVPEGDATGHLEGYGPCVTAQGLAGTCGEIGLETAGDALQTVLQNSGSAARVVFALGLLAAGQASTMTGTFAGQVTMEGFLDMRIPIWLRTLVTRSASLAPAIVVAILTENNQNLNNQVNQWINVIMSLQLPFALLPLLIFTADPKVMGAFANRRAVNVICWTLALVIIGLNVYLTFSELDSPSSGVWAAVGIGCACYIIFLLLIVRRALGWCVDGLRSICSKREP